MRACVRACMRAYVRACERAYARVCMCVCVCVRACVRACVCVCVMACSYVAQSLPTRMAAAARQTLRTPRAAVTTTTPCVLQQQAAFATVLTATLEQRGRGAVSYFSPCSCLCLLQRTKEVMNSQLRYCVMSTLEVLGSDAVCCCTSPCFCLCLLQQSKQVMTSQRCYSYSYTSKLLLQNFISVPPHAIV